MAPPCGQPRVRLQRPLQPWPRPTGDRFGSASPWLRPAADLGSVQPEAASIVPLGHLQGRPRWDTAKRLCSAELQHDMCVLWTVRPPGLGGCTSSASVVGLDCRGVCDMCICTWSQEAKPVELRVGKRVCNRIVYPLYVLKVLYNYVWLP